MYCYQHRGGSRERSKRKVAELWGAIDDYDIIPVVDLLEGVRNTSEESSPSSGGILSGIKGGIVFVFLQF